VTDTAGCNYVKRSGSGDGVPDGIRPDITEESRKNYSRQYEWPTNGNRGAARNSEVRAGSLPYLRSSGGTAGESVGSRFAFRKRVRSALVATDDAETPGSGDRTARLRSDNEGIIQ
jgi:hypothetical protein